MVHTKLDSFHYLLIVKKDVRFNKRLPEAYLELSILNPVSFTIYFCYLHTILRAFGYVILLSTRQHIVLCLEVLTIQDA